MKTMTTITGSIRKLMVIIMLTAFFSGSIFSQKSLNRFETLSIASNYLRNSKTEIMKAIYNSAYGESGIREESLDFEFWMSHPTDWNIHMTDESVSEAFVEADLNFEHWMFETSWSAEESFHDEEMHFESWMSSPASWL